MRSMTSSQRGHLSLVGAKAPAAPGPRIVDEGSGCKIVDETRPPIASAQGRHPGTSRTMTAIIRHGDSPTSWVQAASAFEYPDYWHIDVEFHAERLAGIDVLSSHLVWGFRVKSEAAARDWLRLFGALTARATRSSGTGEREMISARPSGSSARDIGTLS